MQKGEKEVEYKTFVYLCNNYNKDPKKMTGKFDLLQERFGHEDNDFFDRVIRAVCDEQKFFPVNNDIVKMIIKMKPKREADSDDFPECDVCGKTGYVTMMIAWKKRKAGDPKKADCMYPWNIEGVYPGSEGKQLNATATTCRCEKGEGIRSKRDEFSKGARVPMFVYRQDGYYDHQART
jgi:hypothetical protein